MKAKAKAKANMSGVAFKKIMANFFSMLGSDSFVFSIYLYAKEQRFLHKADKKGQFSQHGEDVFLVEYFGDRKGVYVDIGASHPFIISNTYMLYRNGWHGVCVEPIPYLYRRHKKIRPRDITLNCLVGSKKGAITFYNLVPSVLSTCDETFAHELLSEKRATLREKKNVNVETLASILEEYLPDGQVDVLSVDVEGLDLEVLKGNDWDKFRPEIIICEVNDSARTAVDEFLSEQSYRFIKCLECNRIYQRLEA